MQISKAYLIFQHFLNTEWSSSDLRCSAKSRNRPIDLTKKRRSFSQNSIFLGITQKITRKFPDRKKWFLFIFNLNIFCCRFCCSCSGFFCRFESRVPDERILRRKKEMWWWWWREQKKLPKWRHFIFFLFLYKFQNLCVYAWIWKRITSSEVIDGKKKLACNGVQWKSTTVEIWCERVTSTYLNRHRVCRHYSVWT